MRFKAIREFIKLESSSGIILLSAAIIALVLDNSPFNHFYQNFIAAPFIIRFGDFSLAKPLLMWINDGLMAIFFLLVGLEIKREILIGELSSVHKMALPSIAAVGGMVVPAIIYYLFNGNNHEYMSGWAIPTATDIAFALGILALLGSKVPSSLKIFLTALAILDDIGAIVIIALFYTSDLSVLSLGLAALCLLALFLLNRFKVTKLSPYCVIGLILWVCILKSGVHATLAGVALAFAIPLDNPKKPEQSPLRRLEHTLHPWVAFLVLPLFAFANAGVNFEGMSLHTFLHPIPLGIIFGLFVGKQIGILGICWLAVKSKLAKLPDSLRWRHIYGAALICGIGFTMSLFIGTLAFDETINIDYARLVRLGVFVGSILSGVCGYFWLYCSKK